MIDSNRKSNIRSIIIELLKEQTFAGVRGNFNLSKYPGPKGSRLKSPEIDGDDANPEDCYLNNINAAIRKCKKYSGKYKSDKNSRKLSDKLYDSLSGISLSSTKTKEIFKEIKDENEFCRVVIDFNKNGDDLYEWIEDEVSLNPKVLWDEILKQKLKYFMGDYNACKSNNFT
jgi:hypothetical protein